MFPPGPPRHHRLNLLGRAQTINALRLDPLGFIGHRFATHGDLYYVPERPSGHLYVTRHPDHMREVLVEQSSRFVKQGGANDRLVPFLGNGLLTADGEVWKRHRRLMQPAFHHARIAGYAQTMVEHAARVDWAADTVIDIGQAMRDLTLGIAAKTLFDHDITGDSDTIGRVMDGFQHATRLSLIPDWIPTPRRMRGRRATRQIDELVTRLVAERRRDGLTDDLLSMLLEIDGLSDTELRDELVTLFIAGHDTTSHALTWTWMLLARHPAAHDRLLDELGSVLAGRLPTVTDLPQLPWTRAVIDEAMRLYPPAYAVARVAAEPAHLGGYPLDPGAQVVLWIWHAHRDGRWFRDPLRFRPERFMGEPEHPKHAYLPFGAGTRQCIGRGFALMEMALVLATLAQKYALELVSKRVEPAPRITLGPKSPVMMRARRR